MQRIYPVCEEKALSCVGKPICAVMHDGTCFQGIVSEVRDGKIYFARRERGTIPGKSTAKKSKANEARTSGKAKAGKAAVSVWGYPGYGYGFGYPRTFALDLALIALLFTIPFIGFPFYL